MSDERLTHAVVRHETVMLVPDLGRKLDAVRRGHGLTLAQLARLAGVSRMHLHRYWVAETDVPEPVLVRLCTVLGLRVDWLGEPLSRFIERGEDLARSRTRRSRGRGIVRVLPPPVAD